MMLAKIDNFNRFIIVAPLVANALVSKFGDEPDVIFYATRYLYKSLFYEIVALSKKGKSVEEIKTIIEPKLNHGYYDLILKSFNPKNENQKLLKDIFETKNVDKLISYSLNGLLKFW